MIIDAHQHFWRPTRGDYGWLTPDLSTIFRDFMPEDLEPLLRKNGIEGTVLVQAAPTLAETDFLLQIADDTPFVMGVVGWIDFENGDACADMARLAAHPKLVGLRPMIQDIADDKWMLRPEFSPVFEAMVQHDLTFDALVFPRHLPHLHQLLIRHPDLRVVIDHAAKPDIAGKQFDDWATHMTALAHETDAYCKMSGLLNQAGNDWNASDLAPYMAHLFDEFGAQKLIWGSDWPVLTLAAGYEQWWQIAKAFVDGPSATGRTATDRIFGLNAIQAYKLKMPQKAGTPTFLV